MKNIVFLAAMLLAPVLCGCGDDNDDTPQTVFPETQVIGCQAGDRQQLTFDAASAWKLTSDAIWCRFVEGETTVASTAGAAGRHTLTLAITDEGQTNDKASTAKLAIYMEGRQGILAEVTRSAAGYELKVYDADGNEISQITAAYDAYTTFQVKANFAFAATSFPEWAELRGGWMTGAANTMTAGALLSREKNEQSGSIVFQDKDGLATFSIPVAYNGMDRDAIVIGLPGGNPWNWTATADGKTWTHSENDYTGFIACTITAYADDYEVVCLEETADGLCMGADWVHFSKATGRITLDATEAERTAYVLAFPRALYNSLPESIITAEGIAYTYQQRNLVVQVKQRAPKAEGGPTTSDEVGFTAVCFTPDWEMIEIECLRIVDKATLDHCEQILGTRDVFLLDKRSPRGHFDMVTPYPLLSSIDDLDPEKLCFIDDSGNRLEDIVPETQFVESSTPNYWTVIGCSNSDTPIYLLVEDKEGKMKKALKILTDTDVR